jgi:hypothetical protein
MEYEDYFHPTNDNAFASKNLIMDIKLMDKGYNKLKRIVKTINGKKKISVEVYSSGDIGSNIRDAITGHFYPFKVGSSDEDSFFKVCITTGEVKNQRRLFFFSSPNDYEKLFMTSLKEETKIRWNKKQGNKFIQLENN